MPVKRVGIFRARRVSLENGMHCFGAYLFGVSLYCSCALLMFVSVVFFRVL